MGSGMAESKRGRRVIKTLRTIWAAVVLLIGVLLAASFVSTFMLFIAFPWGAIAAVLGSEYWFNVWVGFDKFCNALLGGDHRETISSRLGKSTIFDHNPVFGFLWIDELVSWWLHQVDNNHVAKSIDWDVGEGR